MRQDDSLVVDFITLLAREWNSSATKCNGKGVFVDDFVVAPFPTHDESPCKNRSVEKLLPRKAVRSPKTPIARIIPNRESQKEFVAFVKFVFRLLPKQNGRARFEPGRCELISVRLRIASLAQRTRTGL